MWTDENRSLYERKGVRYPSDLTDREWTLIEALIPPAKRGGRPRQVDVREVMNGVLYVLATGCQWRALPKDLPAKSTVHVNGGAKRDHLGGVRRDRLAAAGLSP